MKALYLFGFIVGIVIITMMCTGTYHMPEWLVILYVASSTLTNFIGFTNL